jgi:hypothetical protein
LTESKYFLATDIFPTFLWLVIIIVVGYGIRNSKINTPHFKYFMPNLYMKIGSSMAFALFYIFYYGGGDTTAYYDGSVALNNLFFKSPELFFENLTTTPDMSNWGHYFDARTGYPPSWIYKEPEAFFVSKIMSILTFFTLKSYLASTVVISAFASMASWKLFSLIRQYNFCNEKYLALGILFLPSVNFWCSGISKDTVVIISTMLAVYHGFKIVSLSLKSTLRNWIFFLFNLVLIYHIRDFIFLAIMIPFTLAISARFVKVYGGGDYVVIIVRTLIFVGGIALIGGSVISKSEEDFLESNSLVQQASTIQNDFANNETYGTKRYDLGEITFTPVGLAQIMPVAVMTGIFRPFIWESLSATLILNGLESVMFLYFTYLFFRRKPLKKFKQIRGHEFLIFAMFFVFIIAFMTGLTSGLYGVLVRLRAILLPFLFVLLTFEPDKVDQVESDEEIDTKSEPQLGE